MKRTIHFSMMIFVGIIGVCTHLEAQFSGAGSMPQNISAENADLVVAQDGTGDYNTIQAAIDAAPTNPAETFIVLIRNGTYNEKIYIEKSNLVLVGEDQDDTQIVYAELRSNWIDEHSDDWGSAVVNIGGNITDVTLANLTIHNNYGSLHDDNGHQFAIRGFDATRIIIVHCNIIADGGDTLSLWDGETGMYYHADCYFEGYVDYVCPRGWCYIEDSEFFGHNRTASIWHDGSADRDQKFVIRHSHFDGVEGFPLGRYHHDSQFYLLGNTFSENMADQPIYEAGTAEEILWGKRTYYFDDHRESGDYEWFADNIREADSSLTPAAVTAEWTFDGAWNPGETMPAVLPFSYMPAPANSEIKVSRTPQLTWIPGRNAVSHDVYLGTQNPPQYRTSTTDATYIPDELASNTQYYWRVDAVTADSTITGPTWTFHTETDQAPPQATDPVPANGVVDVSAPVKRLDWEIDEFQTDTVKLYFGTTPDNLTLKDTYVAPGYKLGPLSLGTTYYWRVDLVNQYGTTEGEVWNFTVESSGYDEADYVQSTGPDGIVSMEAEDYTDSTIIGNHQWTVVTNPEGYSGDGAMQVLPADGSYMFVNYASNASRLDYAVDFKKTGTHYIWVRSLNDNGTNNSIHLGVNGEPLSGLFNLGNYDSTHVWEWINDTAIDIAPPAKFEIKSYGIHGINLWYGKGGAIADKIVITTSPDYVPEGFGPDVTTGLDGENASSVPNSFHLSQNYPNPFNPSTRIDFSLPEETDVKISVYDLTGRLIKILLDNHITTGEHTIQWNGRNQYQQLVPSGIYFYEIRTDSYQRCKKMVLLR